MKQKRNTIFIALLFFLIYSKTKAQYNLVPNASFEIYTSCPTASGQINRAIPWHGNPSVTTTDYYNSCAVSGPTVPLHGSTGFQYPKSGSAYAGIWAYDGVGMNYREYLQTVLLDSLIVNKCYFVTFFVNLSNGSQYAVNNLACNFSNTLIDTTGTGYVLNLPSHISFPNNPIINDTLNWVRISGIYISTGGEKYITIGNFKNNISTDTIIPNYSTNPAAYYYIDDVSVTPVDSIPSGMPAFAGNDTSLTIGDSVFIGQQISNLDCNWYNASGGLVASNISGVYVQPTNTTYYVVEQNLCGTITYDTVNVVVLPVGITDTRPKNEINIFPNPTTGIIYISSKDLSLADIILNDLTGKIIFSRSDVELNQELTELNLIAENGIYFIHIRNSIENEEIVKKIILNK